jgi:1,2-phenylacetyl-CoA epoxidase catalytic subunit
VLLEQWLARVVPVLTSATLSAPATPVNGKFQVRCDPDLGGRQGRHSEHLRQLVEDLQMVYRSVPGGNW